MLQRSTILAIVVVLAPSASAAQSLHTALSASLVTFNALDARSTRAALARGAEEANPFMRPFTGVSMSIAKAVSTGTTVWATRRLWQQGRRKTSLAVLISANVALAFIAHHNNSVR